MVRNMMFEIQTYIGKTHLGLLYFCTQFARFGYEILIRDVLMEKGKGLKQCNDRYHLKLSESWFQIKNKTVVKICVMFMTILMMIYANI